jgi:2-keto-4-pentenoate hydratase/2-oxohepta-3-ene-1,7-dioic acid hydratase in catechol pathway
MRITRFLDDSGKTLYGNDLGDGSAEVIHSPPLVESPQMTGKAVRIARRLAPIEPVNLFCIGKNYLEHAAESDDGTAPARPIVFMKPTSSLNHPGDPISLPACSPQPEVDYEGELAVVIGTPGRDIPKARALEHVLGYTIGHDVSARWWQKIGGSGQWVRGKGFDTFCPLGPVLVTADEIPDPQALAITTTLNGQVMQQGNTSDMIFPVDELIAFLSQDTTLLPGTVILTGTPAGVGAARKPPVFLQHGDEVSIEIDPIGKLTNPVVEAEDDE